MHLSRIASASFCADLSSGMNAPRRQSVRDFPVDSLLILMFAVMKSFPSFPVPSNPICCHSMSGSAATRAASASTTIRSSFRMARMNRSPGTVKSEPAPSAPAPSPAPRAPIICPTHIAGPTCAGVRPIPRSWMMAFRMRKPHADDLAQPVFFAPASVHDAAASSW